MKPADIDRVFGRGRLRMVTGDHVEVFREPSQPGERRRYTKRFLATAAGDFSEWTEREWRILARLVGHGIKPVPDVVRYDRGASDRAALVQTYDAGITVDHWATLLPLERDGTTLRNVFEDCAHWWALARHSLIALDAIHELRLVHLDLKADNVCIPLGPADFDPHVRGQLLEPRFDDIALIDFAFSLVSGERLESALPIAQQADYEYQSPRLLHALEAGRHGDLGPTRQLDWRCDLFSLAAMLWRYLPELEDTTTGDWTRPRHAMARALVRRLIEAHAAELPAKRPHAELIALAAEPLAQPQLSESLQRGWTLAFDSRAAMAAWPTPVTRIALPVTAPVVAPVVGAAAAVAVATAPRTPVSPAAIAAATGANAIEPGYDAELRVAPDAAREGEREALAVDPTDVAIRLEARRLEREQRVRRFAWAAGLATTGAAALAALAWLGPSWRGLPDSRDLRVAAAPAEAPLLDRTAPIAAREAPRVAPMPKSVATEPVTAIAVPAVAAEASAPAAIAAKTTAPPTDAALANAAPASPASTSTASTTQADDDKRTAIATKPVGADTKVAALAPKSAVAAAMARSGIPGGRARLQAHVHAPEPMPARAPTSRSVRAAMPFPAPSRPVRAGTARTAAAKPPASPTTRVAGLAGSRRSAGGWGGNGTPTPWAVAGRAAPRITLAKAGSGERGAVLPSTTAAPAIAAPPPSRAAEAGSSVLVNVNASPSTNAAAAPPATPPSTSATSPTALAVVARPTLSPDSAPAASVAATLPSAGDGAPIDYAARASELMASQVPRLAQRAERMVARVLFAAGRSEQVAGDNEIRAAAGAVGRDGGDALAGLPISAREAQRFGDAARAEYARRGGTPEALALQARAFGANPLDVEAAGNLAFLLLRQRPAQAEPARQLALHALAVHGARYPEGRIEDWATLAIASALAGRERDAKNAFLVVLSLAPNIERQCKAALDVYALYGERLRAPVEAMLHSANASGRASGSSLCEWPPHWVASGATR